MPTNPSPRTWTLRFKHHRSTTILHVDPLHTFSTIKAELLRALNDTNPTGSFNGQTLPQNTDDVLLARPVDIHDLSRGWERLQRPDGEDDSEAGGKGKGKVGATATGGKRKENSLKDCPQGAGLKDGSIVAFKFRSMEGEAPQAGDADAEDDEIAIPSEVWDVVVPTMEETYGDQDAMEEDVGDEGAVV